MARTIRVGDVVTVHFVNGEKRRGSVLHVPADIGDMWYIRDSKGAVGAINPFCANLKYILREPIKDES